MKDGAPAEDRQDRPVGSPEEAVASLPTAFGAVPGPCGLGLRLPEGDKTGLAVLGAFILIEVRNEQHPGGKTHVLEAVSKKQRQVTRST